MLVPFIGAIIVFIASRKSEELGSIITMLTCGATFLVTALVYSVVRQGEVLTLNFNIGLPFPISFRIDALGIFLSLISTILWFLASIYSIEYIKHRKTLFNVFLLFCLYGILGVSITGNLFSLILFFELFSLTSAVLVIHEGTPEALKAGFQYLFMSIVSSVCIIVASALLYNVTKNLDFVHGGSAALNGSSFKTLIFWLLTIGFAVKAGMFPVHVWLPEAHPIAPSPASALLSGVMIKVGAYGIIRTVYGIFGISLVNNGSMSKILLVLAVITMILGSILAIAQTELKRLLAYSSIAQIGYVILGIALLTPKGLTGGIFHIFNHALMKGALFLCAGAIISQTGLRNLEDLKGIGKKMPLTMLSFTMAAFSMVGIPPFSGFLSKWFLALGALQAEKAGFIGEWAGIGIVGALIISSLLNAVYYGPILIGGWFGASPDQAKDKPEPHGSHDGYKVHHEEEKPLRKVDPSLIMLAPMLFLAVGTLFFGIFPSWPLSLASSIVKIYF
jgi:multicomponent Na+:H+ antiporter subunit D